MSDIPGQQWSNWARRVAAGEHLEEEMQNAGALPNWETPLPPTNATIHLLGREDGYGTPDRAFTMLCGVSWLARESGGASKYVMPAETGWRKHVNCAACRALMGGGA